MKLNHILKDKKGVVMEMTIIYVLIASLFCMVILAVSLTMESHNRYIAKRTLYQMELERIGDAFVAGDASFALEDGESFKILENYSKTFGYIYVTENDLSVYVKNEEPERLHVTIDGDRRVTSWNLNLD